MMKQYIAYIIMFVLCAPGIGHGITFELPRQGNVVGYYATATVKKGTTLLEVGQAYDIGVQELLKANPKVGLMTKLPDNYKVKVPAEFRLPSAPWTGIILNLAKKRIYYFHPDGIHVSTYPVGVGKQGWATPQGQTQIVAKEKNPAWRPPASLQREAAGRGKSLPLVVPPGPRNPLGQYAMRLGFKGAILIHGTNQPSSVGLNSSHGCIRMYPASIKELFGMTELNTPVRIVNEP